MRTQLRTAIVTAGLAIAMLAVGAMPVSATTSVADLSVTASGKPTSVSPPGGIAVYTASVTNHGPAIAPAQLTNATTNGSYVSASSQLAAGCTAPANGTSNPTISCSFTLAVGETRQISVAIRTLTVESTVTNQTDAAVPPSALPIVDQNDGNNHATVTTPVFFDPNQSRALVRQGETLSFQGHVLSVRLSQLGVLAALSVAPSEGAMCGNAPCGEGLRADFDTDPNYQGSLGLLIDFGKGNPCRGLGAGADCTDLYIRKNGVTSKLPTCLAAPTAAVCIESVNKNGAALQWTVRMGSTDPDFLPPLKPLQPSQG